MRIGVPITALVIFGCAVSAAGDGLVVLSLSSPSSGAAVPPGFLIQWTITASVSTGNNQGLALFSVELVQDPANPVLFDLPPAVRPVGMEGFDRPRGLCNPGTNGSASSYGGTPTGAAGARNLNQIGGAQNTFGLAGIGQGEDTEVDAGIGQGPNGQIIAIGSFVAPRLPGTYSYTLQAAVANTLLAIRPAPDSSTATSATVTLSPARLTFNVCRPADVDQDGVVSLAKDLPLFVDVLLGTDALGDLAHCAADLNRDETVNGDDIQPFVDLLLLSAMPRDVESPPPPDEPSTEEEWATGLGAGPTIPGDGNLDWSIDAADLVILFGCLSGPGGQPSPECLTYDFDGNGDVDLRDLASFQVAFSSPPSLGILVSCDADDGTEVSRAVWFADGCDWFGHNYIGTSEHVPFDAAFRFHLPQVRQGETFTHVRLALPVTGFGHVESAAVLRIVGVSMADPPPFYESRPSQLPKTNAFVDWILTSDWPDDAWDFDNDPVIRYTPDIAPIINEIVQRPDWGQDGHTTVAIVVENRGPKAENYLVFTDYHGGGFLSNSTVSPKLELYRTPRAALIAKELLGRPTDRSVTVNAVSLATLEVYFEYGPAPSGFTQQSPVVSYPGGTPIEVLLDGLSADTAYTYRMRYRLPGASDFAVGPEHTFHTQRGPGSSFRFVVQSDSHLHNYRNEQRHTDLYRTTLANVWADAPDFLIDLGDTFNSESYDSRSDWPWLSDVDSSALDLEEAVQRHLEQRPYLDLVCHSVPFFAALGNHEGEQGWRLSGSPSNLAVWACQARKMIYPLPAPDQFYSGNQEDTPTCGLREDYYAWEWGDALFVVLDPFWYTSSKPHPYGGPGSGDNWDWTLGQAQYDWLVNTLKTSSATFKFVFAHQVTGGVDTYGRGGIEAARYQLAKRGSFEWGGEDSNGARVFATERPGWLEPIHQLMAESNVTIFFHGHDHCFVEQELDGVVYQECPQPDESSYGYGFAAEALYNNGHKVSNSGHLRVSVTRTAVTVEYIRAYLPGEGINGKVGYSYTIPAK